MSTDALRRVSLMTLAKLPDPAAGSSEKSTRSRWHFVGVDHYAVQDRGHRWLGPLRGLVNGAHDGPHAEAQLMHGVQIPLDAS